MPFASKKFGSSPLPAALLSLVLVLAFCPPVHAADIELEWSNVTDDDLTGYTIYYRPDYCCDYKQANGSLAQDVATMKIPVNGAPLNAGTLWDELVPGLDEHRSYYFVVTATNDNGEESGFSNEARRKAPQIINQPVVTHVDSSTAVIEWQTDTAGNTVLFYRKDGSSESKWNPQPAVFRTRHSAILENLNPNTTYRFRAGSSNHLGYDWDLEPDDENPSAEYSFKTTIDEDNTWPVIVNGPTVESITGTSAIVKWQTDEPSNTKVRYDTSPGDWKTYSYKKEEFGTYIIDHAMILTGLKSDTKYYFRVASVDPVAHQTVSAEYTFRTYAGIDTIPPIFTSQPFATFISDNTVIIEWETNEPCNSKLRWGTESASWRTYPSNYQDFTQLVRNHKVTITGLKSDTKYYFRAGSADSNTAVANQTISAEFIFTTAQTPDMFPPEITSFPVAVSISDTRATIRWATNEPANSTVIYSQNNWPQPIVKSLQELTIHHSVTLTNLSPESKYSFAVASTDAKGNGPTKSPETQFITLASQDTKAPQIVSTPTITATNNQTVTVEWQTDEPSNSMVWYCQESDDDEIGNKCPNPRTWNNIKPQITDPVAATNHRIIISNLDGDSTYYLIVGGADVFGNGPDTTPGDNNPSREIMVQTDRDPDTVAPQITAPPAVIAKTDTAAIIEWETDEPSNSLVQYGTAPASWGSYPLVKNDINMVTRHLVALTNLAPGSNYFFRVGSVDEHGNGPDVSREVTFTTDDESSADAPVIVLPPTVTAISNSSAIIEWITDEPGNSVVKYTTSDPFTDIQPELPWDSEQVSIASNGSLATHHRVTLTNLEAETRYKYRVGSTDAEGNGPSLAIEEKNNPFVTETFTTTHLIDNSAPRILFGPVVNVDENNVSLDDQSVIIEWETDEPSTGMVKFGVQQDLQEKIGGTNWDNLPWSKNSAEMKTMHQVTLTNLNPGTSYTFRVGSADAPGNGPDLNPAADNPSGLDTFITADIPDKVAPRITNVQVFVVTDKTALITWETDEPSNSIVRFAPGRLGSPSWQALTMTAINGEMSRRHSVTLTGLTPSESDQQRSYYTFMVGSTDANGNGPALNPSEANPFSRPEPEGPYFWTEVDPDNEAPRILGDVKLTAVTDRLAVIEWETDEPGNSQVQYSNPAATRQHETGSNSWGNYPLSENDAEMVKHHKVTITGLVPDSLYYFRVSSTDASGNNHATSSIDENPSVEYNLKTKEADPPSIIRFGDEDYPDAYPKVDHANNTIDLTYDEANMINATGESFYTFSPPLVFANPGASIQEISSGKDYNAFRLYFKSIPPNTILTLKVAEEITDVDRYPVTPSSIVLNDLDGDELPDDWEVAHGLNPTSGDAEIGEGKLGDFDGDGQSNYDEFLNNSDPKDNTSFAGVPRIVKSLPYYDTAARTVGTVPDNTAFGVLVVDRTSGIDLGEPGSVSIEVDDSVNQAYSLDLSNEATVRTVKLNPTELDSAVSAFWVVYDRAMENDAELKTYPFEARVRFTVEIRNKADYLIRKDFYYEIESQLSREVRLLSRDIVPVAVLEEQDIGVNDPDEEYDMGLEVISGELEHTKIIYHSGHPVTPLIAKGDEEIDNVDPVSPTTIISPSTVFSPPAQIIIPVPGTGDVKNVGIYVKEGNDWVRSCSNDCDVDANGYGWMVPGSRVNHNNGSPSSIEIMVYHSAGFQAGVATGAEATPTSADEEAGAKCFVDTLLY